MQEQFEQKEMLSALLDGEAGGDAAKFFARRVEHDPEAAAQLGRWQFAGDALRARASQNAQVDLRAALRQQLAESAAVAPADSGRNRTFSRKTAGIGAAMAMAAALGVVVFSVRSGLDAPNTPAGSAPVAAVASSEQPQAVMPAEKTQAPAAIETPAAPTAVAAATRTPEPERTHVRPWRVPADADAMIARASAPKPIEAKSQAAVAVAAVPKAIKRSDDMERVLRGKSVESALGTEAPAQAGWPRAVIPGIDGAYNASFNTGAAVGFGRPQTLDAPKN